MTHAGRSRSGLLARVRAAIDGTAQHDTTRDPQESAAAATQVALADIKRRLELLLRALYDRELTVDALLAPRRRDWSDYFINRAPRHLRGGAPLATASGTTILLPQMIDASQYDGDAATRYRLLAITQAERLVRGTHEAALALEPPLLRELFLVAEGAIVDAAIVALLRDGDALIGSARREALASRPETRGMTTLELATETLVRLVLASDLEAGVAGLSSGASTERALAWATERHAELTTAHAGVPFRGIAPVPYWGAAWPAAPLRAIEDADPNGVQSQNTLTLPTAGARSAEQEDHADAQGAGGDASGAPTDVRAPDSASGGSQGTSDSGDAPTDAPKESGGRVMTRAALLASPQEIVGEAPPVLYPEWDLTAGLLRARAVAVRPGVAAADGGAWASAAISSHASTIRAVRQRFERLRAHRARLHRQRQGDALDLAACVDAFVDRRTDHAPSDRLYLDVRPARRAMAIAVLVDVSGSTGMLVTARDRIIDFEKLAVLLASEAFDALGDRYALFTFSSRGAADVRVTTVKSFAARNGDAVRDRIGAITPSGNTRLGAAIRHMSALLAHESAGHRLLFVVSDGKPSDADGYMGPYAAEDSRQAVLEARSAGVFPFCFTVDREEPEGVAHVFGTAGYVVIQQVDQLPDAMLRAVRQVISG